MEKCLKVSIIIPVYNGADFVREAIDSALAQDYPNFEVVVVNDGSKDKGATDRICKSYGRKIRYYKKPNGGVATALNLGITKMKGEYFSWLSHDDVYFPNKVSSQMEFIKNQPPKVILYSDFIIINEHGRQLDKVHIPDFAPSAFPKELMLKSFLHGCTLLIPKKAFEKAGNFNEKLITTQDYELWFRIIKAGFVFEKCPGYLVKARAHAGQGTITKKELHLREKDEMYVWILKNFEPSQLFGSSADLRLEYANLNSIFGAAGFKKSSQLAEKLSLKNTTAFDRFYLNCLLPAQKMLSIPQKFAFKLYRYAKRRMAAALGIARSAQTRDLSPPLKICLIGNIQSVHSLKLCHYFLQKSFSVYFISNRPGAITGVEAKIFAPRSDELKLLWFWRAIVGTRRRIQEIKPDIVHCQSLVPAGIWVNLSGFHPYIVWLFGSEIFKFDQYNPILKLLVARALRQADKITGSSQVLMEEAIQRGARRNKTQMILNGVDLNVFKPRQAAYKTRIIFCPRAIKPIYQTLVLVQAFEKMTAQNPNFQLALIKFNVDPNYLNQIKAYIKKKKLTKKVTFWPGAENRQMAQYYRRAEVVVSIPQWDSSSVTFLEALACEKKLVVSNLPFLKEWPQIKVWTAVVGDVNSTAEAILRAIAAPGPRNRPLVVKQISLEANFERLIELYQDLIIQSKSS